MPDDWVRDFMGRQNAKQEEEKLKAQKARWAEKGAGETFGRLQERLKKDVEQFHRYSGDPSFVYTELSELSPEAVEIHKMAYPSITLRVELRDVIIRCRYTYRHDETSTQEEKKHSLRIAASSDGRVQIYRNGSPYSDESDVSQLLLEPVFYYGLWGEFYANFS